MKAIFWVALVALVLSLAQCSTACTVVNRRNTKWIGLPGPTLNAARPLYVRVLRTDKYNYNMDGVDATVAISNGALEKVKSTFRGRTTPAGGNMSLFSLANTTSSTGDTRPAWSLLRKIQAGVFEIMFRAFYDDFPVPVDIETDKLYWMSDSTSDFYFGKSTGEMVIVRDISGDNRDFNSTTSDYTIFNFGDLLRNNATANSTVSNEVGNYRVHTWDAIGLVAIPYGTSEEKNCNDGYVFMYYGSSNLTLAADIPENTVYYLNPSNSWLTYITPNNTLVVESINATSPGTILQKHYTEAQMAVIINRYRLGAWLGPLIVIAVLWLAITGWCALCNRSRC